VAGDGPAYSQSNDRLPRRSDGALLSGRAPYSPRTSDEAATAALRRSMVGGAYGFRDLGTTAGSRGVRRTAGALYPTRSVGDVTNRGAARHAAYQFTAHEFFAVPNALVTAASGADGPLIDIHVISVFWRTVQRYGVRGYRYCLLDAANVVDNLVYLLRSVSPHSRQVVITASRELNALLALEYGEGCIGTLRVPADGAGSFRCPDESLQLFDGGIRDATEAAPFLSPTCNA